MYYYYIINILIYFKLLGYPRMAFLCIKVFWKFRRFVWGFNSLIHLTIKLIKIKNTMESLILAQDERWRRA